MLWQQWPEHIDALPVASGCELCLMIRELGDVVSRTGGGGDSPYEDPTPPPPIEPQPPPTP